jgi:hypothetical protein
MDNTIIAGILTLAIVVSIVASVVLRRRAPGADNEHVKANLDEQSNTMQGIKGMYFSIRLLLYYLAMTLSRGSTSGHQSSAKCARDYAERLLGHTTLVLHYSNIAQYAASLEPDGSVAAAANASYEAAKLAMAKLWKGFANVGKSALVKVCSRINMSSIITDLVELERTKDVVKAYSIVGNCALVLAVLTSMYVGSTNSAGDRAASFLLTAVFTAFVGLMYFSKKTDTLIDITKGTFLSLVKTPTYTLMAITVTLIDLVR